MIALPALIQQCTHEVPAGWMQAIIQTESRGNPLAINVNGGEQLAHAPQTPEQAITTATWLLQRGYSFDAGIAQINSANFRRLNLDTRTVFEPCTNIKAAAHIFAENYRQAFQTTHDPDHAVMNAISMYNTGNQNLGYANGYVRKIVDAAASNPDVIPLVRKDTAKPAQPRASSPKPEKQPPNPYDVYDKTSKPDQSKVY